MVGASSTGHQTGSGVLNRLQPVHQSFRDAEEQEQRVAVVQAAKCKVVSFNLGHSVNAKRREADTPIVRLQNKKPSCR